MTESKDKPNWFIKLMAGLIVLATVVSAFAAAYIVLRLLFFAGSWLAGQ